jgi:hypothetical protein
MSTFLNVTMYPQYNNNIIEIKFTKKQKKQVASFLSLRVEVQPLLPPASSYQSSRKKQHSQALTGTILT